MSGVRTAAFVRRAGALALPLAIVGALLWARFGAAVPVQMARVDRGTVTVEAFGRGTIESQREAALGFDLVGRLSEVLVDEGARVTLGQELARLETEQAEAELHTAQTGIVAARAALQRLSAEEERARALLATAEREAVRAQAMLRSGTAATREHDEATDRVRVARADLDRVLAQRREATRGIDVAVGGAEQRRVAMVRAALLAPFDGLVTRRLREPGDTVSIGSTVLRMVDTEHVIVRAAIDETMLASLATEQPATLRFPRATETLSGRVSRIPWEADRQTHELIVEVSFDRLERRVAIGQRVDVRIEVERREDALRVPMGMIHHDAEGSYVYADHDGRIEIVRPTFGITGSDHAEVLDGLEEGDALLAAPGTGVALAVGRRWEAR